VIYAWTGNGYSDVSSQYPKYYRQQLACLRKEIQRAEAQKESYEQQQAENKSPAVPMATTEKPLLFGTAGNRREGSGETAPPMPPPTMENGSAQPELQPAPVPRPQRDSYELDCTKVEAAKIKRFLGISSNAGMSDAIRFAESENPSGREYASDLLYDIGTAEAMRYLETLSRDPDQKVARSAKVSLSAIQKPIHTQRFTANSYSRSHGFGSMN
jgi:hypothetical protein